MNIKLSKPQVENICKFGKGEDCCSFLIFGGDGFSCAKGTSVEATISYRRFLETMRAMGDNCSGPPEYKIKE